jgi:hypothetical protein
MRSSYLVLALSLYGCGGNDVDPRTIPGGGIGDGEIDGTVHVTVIDDDDNPIANAEVRVGDTDKTTNETGLVSFDGVEGPQTVSVKASGFVSTVWVGANGANVTIPLNPLTEPVPEQATLSGTITGWDAITVAAGHAKIAAVFYSQTDDLGDAANQLDTPATLPNGGNVCFGPLEPAACSWDLVSRAGPVTIIAAIIDRDGKNTQSADDDTSELIGWAIKTGVTVNNGVGQTGLALDMVEAGNLETVTVDLGTSPAGLTTSNAVVGVEVGDDEVIQIPLIDFINSDLTSVLMPKPSVFGSDSTYRLTAIAQTSSGEDGAQSIVLRRGNTSPALAAGEWLIPPTGVTVTRADASWEPVAGAVVQQVQYQDVSGNNILEITTFDNSSSVTIPSLVALPTSGTLTARVAGLGATLDPTDFSLEEDEDLVFAIAAEPATVP